MTDHSVIHGVRASRQDDPRPRPQLLRTSFLELDGIWGFAYDDADRGLAERWFDGREFPRTITVPFPPESPASGIGEPGFHPVVWYRRVLTAADLAGVGHAPESRLVAHFGAVDYRARVWVDGLQVGEHEGGHTPFAVDLTDALADGATHTLVVRAEDDPHDLAQPRGKQDWLESPHAIWYHRTTGIWQPVWLESVAADHITALWWTSDLARGTVTAHVELSTRSRATVSVKIAHDGEELGAAGIVTSEGAAEITIPVAGQRNGQAYEQLLWRPGSPTLLDAWATVAVDGVETDAVASYLGIRAVRVDAGQLLLNDRPVFMRSVLSQGYWPDSHLAATGDDLRREAELIADLGFNAVRVHQKIEDPRFLFHADRLGLLVWGEMAATYEFSAASVARTTAEWTEAVRRDRGHPSIVTWVPLNESWGVQHIASRPDQRAFAEAMYHLTKALDQTRPVISNDGWEHGTTDLWTLHDYESDRGVLDARYGVDETALRAWIDGIGPAGRRVRLDGAPERGQPIMLTEFGGVKWSADSDVDGSWGYSEADGAEDFDRRVADIFEPVQSASIGHAGRSAGLAGWCWTQLTDTLQERNGLVTEHRKPKLPIERLRALITGASVA